MSIYILITLNSINLCINAKALLGFIKFDRYFYETVVLIEILLAVNHNLSEILIGS